MRLCGVRSPCAFSRKARPARHWQRGWRDTGVLTTSPKKSLRPMRLSLALTCLTVEVNAWAPLNGVSPLRRTPAARQNGRFYARLARRTSENASQKVNPSRGSHQGHIFTEIDANLPIKERPAVIAAAIYARSLPQLFLTCDGSRQ